MASYVGLPWMPGPWPRMGSAPALSAPCAVGRDDHLPAIIRVRVVHVQLQTFSFVRFNQREKVLRLQKSGSR